MRFSAPGFSPLEAEREVARLAEKSLRGMRDIRSLESVSRSGEVVVWLRLEKTAHLFDVRSQVAERLQSTSWPDEMLEPKLSSASNGPILLLALHSEAGHVSALRSTAERVARQLHTDPGIAHVSRFPPPAQVEVCVDENRLRSYDLTVEDVARILRQQNSSLPDLPLEEAEILLRSRDASTIENFAETPLRAREDGSAIRLADVANVRLGWPDAPEPRSADWPSGWILIGVQVESADQSAACSLAMDEALQSGRLPSGITATRRLGVEHEGLLADSIRFWEVLLPPGTTLRKAKSPQGYLELTPVPADLCCRVTGPDIDELRRVTAEVAQQLASHQEVAETRIYSDQQDAVLKLEVDADLAARFGLSHDSVTLAARAALGSRIAQIRLDDVTTDVFMRGMPEQGWPASWLSEMSLRTPSGAQVAIGQVGRLALVSEPTEIWHYDTARCMFVQATARDNGAALRTALEQPLVRIQDRLSTNDSGCRLYIND